MTNKKLIVVSGPDRVGKSTFCSKINVGKVVHHTAPKPNDQYIFQMYLNTLENETIPLIFDRSWVCGHILEEFRRNCTNHILDLVQLEIDIFDLGWDVIHVGISRPWNFSAPLHLTELRELYPENSKWRERDMMVERCREHTYYLETLKTYYDTLSFFPSILITDDSQMRSTIIKLNNWLK